jgi:starvation-inducible DNA-binding protein
MAIRTELVVPREKPLTTPSDIEPDVVKKNAGAMDALLACVFSLEVETESSHWHMSGSRLRDYHWLLDDHGDRLFAMTDAFAERARKLGVTTIRSIAHIGRLRRISDDGADYATAADMLSEVHENEKAVVLAMCRTRSLCDNRRDLAIASTLEDFINEAQWRSWFSF